MGTFNGKPTAEVDLEEPEYGPWFARVRMLRSNVAVILGARAVLSVEGKTWRGTIVGGQNWEDLADVHIVGGAGQLDRQLRTPIHRSDDAGVNLSYVIGAIAGVTGENIQLRSTDRQLGSYWNILGTESAAQALDRTGSPWRVDADGVVRVGAFPVAPKVTVPYSIERADPALGRAIVAPIDPDTLSSFQLGASFEADELDGVIVAKDLRIVENGDSLRVWVNYGPFDNIRNAMLQYARFASVLRSAYPYLVVSEDGLDPTTSLITAQSLYPQIGLPDMVRIPKATGSAGVHAFMASVGQEVLVGFEAGDTSRPFVVGYKSHEPQRVVVRATNRIEIGTNPTRGIARFDDEVDCGELRITTSTALGPTAFIVQHFLNGVPTGLPVTITLGLDNPPMSGFPALSIVAMSGKIDTASLKGFCE